MAFAYATSVMSFSLRLASPCSNRISYNSVRLPLSNNGNSLKLSWSGNISTPIFQQQLNTVTPPRSLTIVAAKGYKMKTHKVDLLPHLTPLLLLNSIAVLAILILKYTYY